MDSIRTRQNIIKHLCFSEYAGLCFGIFLSILYILIIDPHIIMSAYKALIIFAGIIVLSALPLSFILGRKKEKTLQNFYNNELSETELQKRFIRLIRFPIIHGIIIFIKLSIGLLAVSGYTLFYLKTPLINTVSFLIFTLFGAYAAALIIYLVDFSILKDIISMNFVSGSSNYFGMGIKTRSFLFIFIPVLIGITGILFLSRFYLFTGFLQVFKNRLFLILTINSISFMLGFFILQRSQTTGIKRLIDSLDVPDAFLGSTLEDEFGYVSFRLGKLFKTNREMVNNFNSFYEQSKVMAEDLGKSMEQVSGTINTIIKTIQSLQARDKSFSQEINQSDSTVNDIKSFVYQVNQGIKDQASAVNQSSASAEENIAFANNIARTAEEKKEQISTLTRLVEEGENNIDEMAQSIEDISKSAGTILGMMEVINGVAKETNMLAMNASIEAAHAGEYGKGFAVVADEIRKLSETTGSNAKTISSSLTQIIDNIQKAAKDSEATENFIGRIIKVINEMAASMEEMTAGIQEIERGSGQISEGLCTLAETTEHLQQSLQKMDNRSTAIEQSVKDFSQFSIKNSSCIQEINSNLEQIGKSITTNISRFESEISRLYSEADLANQDTELKFLIEKGEKK